MCEGCHILECFVSQLYDFLSILVTTIYNELIIRACTTCNGLDCSRNRSDVHKTEVAGEHARNFPTGDVPIKVVVVVRVALVVSPVQRRQD